MEAALGSPCHPLATVSMRLEDFLEGTASSRGGTLLPLTLMDELHSQMLGAPGLLEHANHSDPMDTSDLGFSHHHHHHHHHHHPSPSLGFVDPTLDSMDWLDISMAGGPGTGLAPLAPPTPPSVFSGALVKPQGGGPSSWRLTFHKETKKRPSDANSDGPSLRRCPPRLHQPPPLAVPPPLLPACDHHRHRHPPPPPPPRRPGRHPGSGPPARHGDRLRRRLRLRRQAPSPPALPPNQTAAPGSFAAGSARDGDGGGGGDPPPPPGETGLSTPASGGEGDDEDLPPSGGTRCQGYYDVMGQWDPPFGCNAGVFLYCCGTCFYRFCCQFRQQRLDQSICSNYDTPIWANTGKPVAAATEGPGNQDRDRTHLVVYVICGAVAIMVLVGIFTKLGLEKKHRAAAAAAGGMGGGGGGVGNAHHDLCNTRTLTELLKQPRGEVLSSGSLAGGSPLS
ncbi:hypothetical protein NHX12_024551, partial [Muraenolepis orangiensis]